ncbi:MAG: hypothetical protein QM713_12380 [Arachnia sp.]
MNSRNRRSSTARAIRIGATTLCAAALGLAGLAPTAHAAEQGTVAVCATDSAGANITLGGDQVWYQVGDGYIRYVGAVGESGCRESTVPAGTNVTVWAAKDGTTTAKKTVQVGAGATEVVDYYTTGVTINFPASVAFGGPRGDLGWFKSGPDAGSREIFGGTTWFRGTLADGRMARTPIAIPEATTTGTSSEWTIGVVDVRSGSGAGLPGVRVMSNTMKGNDGLDWVRDPDGVIRRTGDDGLLAYPMPGKKTTVKQRLDINDTVATGSYVPSAAQRAGSYQTTNVAISYNHQVRYHQEGTPNAYYWLTKSGMELFPGDYTFQFGVPDKKLGTAKQTFPGIDLTLEPGMFAKTAAAVRLTDSQGNGLSDATVSYWRSTAWITPEHATTDGPGGTWVTLFDGKPGKITFALTYEGGRQQLAAQDLTSKSVGYFQTLPVTLSLVDHAGAPLAGGTATFYSSSWRPFGATGTDGVVVKELLPVRHSFAMVYGGSRQQVTVDPVSTAPVAFQTGKVVSTDGSAARYYTDAWRAFPADGIEVLPSAVTLRSASGAQISGTFAPGVVTDVTVG